LATFKPVEAVPVKALVDGLLRVNAVRIPARAKTTSGMDNWINWIIIYKSYGTTMYYPSKSARKNPGVFQGSTPAPSPALPTVAVAQRYTSAIF
jgi:hypothetical protein